MKRFLFNSIGQLRLLAFLEGVSLIVLVFVGVPLKYLFESPQTVKVIGPLHGAFFLLFVLSALKVSVEQNWKLEQTLSRVFLASFIPFGTFYVDSKVLRKLHRDSEKSSS